MNNVFVIFFGSLGFLGVLSILAAIILRKDNI